jgi:hypothetical protein
LGLKTSPAALEDQCETKKTKPERETYTLKKTLIEDKRPALKQVSTES